MAGADEGRDILNWLAAAKTAGVVIVITIFFTVLIVWELFAVILGVLFLAVCVGWVIWVIYTLFDQR